MDVPVLVPVTVEPAAVQVAVYPVIVAPPLEVGAVKATVALALPAVAVPIVGAPGTVSVTVPPELLELLSSPPQATSNKDNAATGATLLMRIGRNLFILRSRRIFSNAARAGLWRQYGFSFATRRSSHSVDC